MDFYSSDRKLSELSMDLNRYHLNYQQPHSFLHQTSIESTSSLSSDNSPLYDNGSSFAIVDVLDFLDTGLHDSSKPFNDFNQDLNTDDNDQWMDYLNHPGNSATETEEGSALSLHGVAYVGGDDDNDGDDDLGFISNQKIKIEEHCYSMSEDKDDDDDNMGDFKLQFDGDLELFHADDIEQDAFAAGIHSSSKLDANVNDLLFVDNHGLGLGDQVESSASPNVLLDVVSQEDLNTGVYDYSGLTLLSYNNNNGISNNNNKHNNYNNNNGGSKKKIISTVNKNELSEFKPFYKIKTEPSEELNPDDMVYYGTLAGGEDSSAMPPTPPSSGCGVNSDSEFSNGELSGPCSPPSVTRGNNKHFNNNNNKHTSSLFSTPIPSSGILILSEEEKRTLLAEGYSLPSKLPLSKQEEKNLKKIRRKIKNKISAQESRRKKKEYLESLEKKVEQMSQENCNLKKRVNLLESSNRSMTSELQRLQGLANKLVKSSSSSLSLSSSSSSSSLMMKTNMDSLSCVIVK